MELRNYLSKILLLFNINLNILDITKFEFIFNNNNKKLNFKLILIFQPLLLLHKSNDFSIVRIFLSVMLSIDPKKYYLMFE